MKNQTFRPLFFKFSLFLAPLAIIFSLAIYIPKLKTWILHQVQTEAPKHAPLSLKISSISFDLLPLGISFNKVTLTPNDELKPILQTTHISKVSLSVSFLSLLKGQLKIGDINIYNSKVSLNLTPLLDSPSSSKTPLSWSQLKMIPIHQVQLHDISAQIRYKDHTHSLETISAALDLNWKSLFLQIEYVQIIEKTIFFI